MKHAIFSLAAALPLFLAATFAATAASNPATCGMLKEPLAMMIPAVEQMATSLHGLDNNSAVLAEFEGAEREAMEKLMASGRELVTAMEAYIATAEDAHYALTVCAR